MILSANITEKSFGPKVLFDHLHIAVGDGEKIGLIGRNGVGKSTLFAILAGRDRDFAGDITLRRGTTLVATAQEHHHVGQQTVMEYILGGLPEYLALKKIIEHFTDKQNPSTRELTEYTDAVERFSAKNYYFIADQVREELKNFQLGESADRPFAALSGGQKRLSEIVKIMHSGAHLALIDEPTNFMDYVAKQQFIDWLKSTRAAVLVITHDRDVLGEVDRMIELKDGGACNYKGNYDFYLRENASRTSSEMTAYEITERRCKNLKQKIIDFKRLKERARDPGTIKQFKRLEQTARAELAELENQVRPSFWIDKDSAKNLGYKDADRYEKFKAKNLRLGLKTAVPGHGRILAYAKDLSLGYETPLFEKQNFTLHEGEKLELRGRNGAGKTTLVRALLGQKGPRVFAGELQLEAGTKVGLYEQEVDAKYFDLTLPAAIEKIHRDKNLSISDQKIRQLLSDYLFTEADQKVLVRDLSGGQKARLQIIAMLSGAPNLLILDEPTSHLDLPSIEELENALLRYAGAILYISHDNYFRAKLGGEIVEIV
ncbi:MAG: ATP-binding cassette domain-containing protein [Candidatus Nomurabacteria bacterium]|nr:ATP-binding cassette domain-containing protein [Candidatus Nomurabacteria bacterium]